MQLPEDMTDSLDFRKKVLVVKERENLSFEEMILRFDIDIKIPVFRWTKQLEPCKTCDKKRYGCFNTVILMRINMNGQNDWESEKIVFRQH